LLFPYPLHIATLNFTLNLSTISMSESSSSDISKCPVMGGNRTQLSAGSSANEAWWPNQLSLKSLRQNSSLSDPMDPDFDYAAEFLSLDLDSVIRDIDELMTTSQDWWPADYGHYGPFFIRMAWHSAGTYRIQDGRGGACSGTLRFAPLNSWPDNANLDKARRLLWPIKQKYGKKLSWADLMILTGNRALETMGFKTFGFAGGRKDIWQPEEDIYWGSETEWLGDKRYTGDRQLENPLGAVQMGLIYVNPEGPNGTPDPLASARDIRETFARMAMNDEETVALIAGGHTFGKAHGAADPSKYVGREPEGAPLEEQGLGWKNSFGKGNAEDTITSGLEGAWTTKPAQWDNNYFDNLFGYEWKQVKSPAGATQWIPTDASAATTVPDAHDSTKKHAPMMFTTDLALKEDPAYRVISKRFHEDPAAFAEAFAKAWYKLTHRDMGPVSCCLGSLVPPAQLWQDPVPAVDHELINDADVSALKQSLLNSGLSISQLVNTAWASASSFRCTDKRGGANGARIRLAPQKDWEVNQPEELAKVLPVLEKIQADFNAAQSVNKKVSLADIIVLGGYAGVEAAAQKAGFSTKADFIPGRTDATQEQTDAHSFSALEPVADAFRNYLKPEFADAAATLLVDRAHMLQLTPPEMTVLLGGMRVLNANNNGSPLGVFTKQPEVLSNDFFANLLSMETEWKKSKRCEHFYEGTNRKTGEATWMGSAVDLLLGSHSELRALAEVYAADDAKEKFVKDFSAAWHKVMNLDRFELKR
jgi:catalase-peroxidase